MNRRPPREDSLASLGDKIDIVNKALGAETFKRKKKVVPSRASEGLGSCTFGQKGGELVRNERSQEQKGRMEEREVWVDVCEQASF